MIWLDESQYCLRIIDGDHPKGRLIALSVVFTSTAMWLF